MADTFTRDLMHEPLRSPSTAPSPALHGLRLGFAALDAATQLLEQVMGLMAIPVVPVPAPGRPRRKHYALAGLRLEARAQSAAAGAGDMADGRPHAADALQWQQADPSRTRQRLEQLGLVALDCADFGCAPCLRVESVDTGACALELREPGPVATAAASAGPGLAAIELRVRAPQSVAAHWARLLGLTLSHEPGGVPMLAASPVPVRFVPASSFEGTGIAALVVPEADAAWLAARALAHGLRVDDEASFSVGGLRVRRQGR